FGSRFLPALIRVLRPRRVVDRTVGAVGHGKVTGRRNHQRRALAIVDPRPADIDPKAAENALDDLLLEHLVIVVVILGNRRRASGNDQERADEGAEQGAPEPPLMTGFTSRDASISG